MKWAVAGLVLFVLAAMLFAPGDVEPVPDRPVHPSPEPDVVRPPPVVPALPPVPPDEGETPPAGDEPLPTDPADRLLRLLDARTKAPVANLASLVITWDGRRRGLRFARGTSRVGLRTRTFDWIVLPRLGVDTGEHSSLEIGLPGYERATIDLRTVPPRSVIALSPADPAAQGTVDLPEGKLDREVRVEVRSVDPERSVPEYAVLVVHWGGNEHTSDGPLMLYDLPDGNWILEITAVVDGAVVSAKKRVSVRDGTADFGEIELVFWAGIRARVVDADGQVVPQAIVQICREEEDETRTRTGVADKDGWVSFRDFEPGMWHRVSAGGLPGPIHKLVLAPEKRGEVKSVELEWPDRLVPCDLAFQIAPGKGERVLKLDGPINITPVFALSPAGARVHLLPGEYAWTATLTKGDETRTVRARLIVPREERFTGLVSFR